MGLSSRIRITGITIAINHNFEPPGVQLVSLRGNMPAHSGGLSGSTVPCGNMIKPTMIMMTVIMIAIAMMSMMIRAKMHLVPKCAKLSC